MNLRHYLFLIPVCFFYLHGIGQVAEKVPLDHSVYESWKTLNHPIISNDGVWASYEINPAKGDGWLYVHNLATGFVDSIARGYGAQFHAGSDFIAFLIKPPYDTIRALKINEVKPDKWPKDTVAVYHFTDNSLYKSGPAQSFKLGEDGGNFVAILLKEEEPEEETEKEKKKREKKDLPLIIPKGGTLTFYWPETGEESTINWVSQYSVSKNGASMALIQESKIDTVEHVKVEFGEVNPQSGTIDSDEFIVYPDFFEKDGWAKGLSLAEDGSQLAFLYSSDTNKLKVYDLYHAAIPSSKAGFEDGSPVQNIADSNTIAFPAGWCVSEHGSIYFSEDGLRLYFESGPIPVNHPKDTVPKDEIAVVDVWNWRDSRLQPDQLNSLEDDQKQSYQCVYDLTNQTILQLANPEMERVEIMDKGNSSWALGTNDNPYERLTSWDWWYEDIYLMSVVTGQSTLVTEKAQFGAHISPNLPRVAYYNSNDSTWYMFDNVSGITHNLTGNLGVAFYDELFDQPMNPYPYSFQGWTEDGAVLIADRYDIWMFQIQADTVSAITLTKGKGREGNVRYQFVDVDPNDPFIDLNRSYWHVFDEDTKDEAYYQFSFYQREFVTLLVGQAARLTSLAKAKDADRFLWKRQTFIDYPDLYSATDFTTTTQVTRVNPQQENYLWGTVEPTSWITPSGKEMDGLVYKPEDFDPNKKYPLIVYFYERYSDDIHNHYIASPSRSVINFPYYLSNGYIIFIPDITYENGHPGAGAVDCIVSGSVHVASNEWVDKEHIGIQGQSWGGYQVAYLVTQTNMYAAGMAGAPVSNMTSAYGGIRWGSGLSRMFQYEHSQSRIGMTLWDSTGLDLYIENSPLFFADEVTTPLLIMHNDEDGAVPWYQGIEYFVALRRLRKPAWLLNYNGDDHNLMEWANRKDLSLRMSQFFGHYLKSEPAPKWMMEGVPALNKGIDYGFELINDE